MSLFGYIDHKTTVKPDSVQHNNDYRITAQYTGRIFRHGTTELEHKQSPGQLPFKGPIPSIRKTDDPKESLGRIWLDQSLFTRLHGTYDLYMSQFFLILPFNTGLCITYIQSPMKGRGILLPGLPTLKISE